MHRMLKEAIVRLPLSADSINHCVIISVAPLYLACLEFQALQLSLPAALLPLYSCSLAQHSVLIITNFSVTAVGVYSFIVIYGLLYFLLNLFFNQWSCIMVHYNKFICKVILVSYGLIAKQCKNQVIGRRVVLNLCLVHFLTHFCL